MVENIGDIYIFLNGCSLFSSVMFVFEAVIWKDDPLEVGMPPLEKTCWFLWDDDEPVFLEKW